MKNNLAKIRGKHGLGQSQLAEMIGISKQGVNFAERQDALSVNLAVKTAEALDENVFEVLGPSVFRMLPKTEEDKAVIRKILEEI